MKERTKRIAGAAMALALCLALGFQLLASSAGAVTDGKWTDNGKGITTEASWPGGNNAATGTYKQDWLFYSKEIGQDPITSAPIYELVPNIANFKSLAWYYCNLTQDVDGGYKYIQNGPILIQDTEVVSQVPGVSNETITAEQLLAGIAYMVNVRGVSFEGITFKITRDLELGGHEWVPIGTDASPFKGSLIGLDDNDPDWSAKDGDGNSIPAANADNHYPTLNGVSISTDVKDVGLVGNAVNSSILNLNLIGSISVGITGNAANVGAVAGRLQEGTVATITSQMTIEVKSASNGDMVCLGGIAGQLSGTVEEAQVLTGSSLNLTGTADTAYVGGIVGANNLDAEGGLAINDATVNPVDINVTGGAGTASVGGILGWSGGTNHTLTMKASNSGGPIENTGAITVGESGKLYAGGIAGYVNDTTLEMGYLNNSGALDLTAAGNDSILHAGGAFGHMAQTSALAFNPEFINTGAVTTTVNGIADDLGSSFAVGGAIGYVNAPVTFAQGGIARNEGAIGFAGAGADHVWVGGLVGNLDADEVAFEDDRNIAEGYRNQGAITVDAGSEVYVGGIVGNNVFTKAADNVSSTGAITVDAVEDVYVGGYVGSGTATESDDIDDLSYAEPINVTVTGTDAGSNTYVGGIIGRYDGKAGSIGANSAVAMAGDLTVKTNNESAYVGGIAGSLTNSDTPADKDIANATVTGAISVTGTADATGTGGNAWVGGVVGLYTSEGGEIHDISYTGTGLNAHSKGSAYVGGVVGQATAKDNAVSAITVESAITVKSEAATGTSYVGGVAGVFDGETSSVTDVQLAGSITSNNAENLFLGGVVGSQADQTTALISTDNLADIDLDVDISATVGGTSTVGGVVGYHGHDNGSISNVRLVGSLNVTSKGLSKVGGVAAVTSAKLDDVIVGDKTAAENNSFTITAVQKTNGSMLGGVVGENVEHTSTGAALDNDVAHSAQFTKTEFYKSTIDVKADTQSVPDAAAQDSHRDFGVIVPVAYESTVLGGANDYLTVQNVTVTIDGGKEHHVGGIVGDSQTVSAIFAKVWDLNLTVKNSTDATNITNRPAIGGVIGWNHAASNLALSDTNFPNGKDAVTGMDKPGESTNLKNITITTEKVNHADIGGVVANTNADLINLKVEYVNITADGSNARVGGLVGYTDSSVVNPYIYKSTDAALGDSKITVTNLANTAENDQSAWVGGIAGYMEGAGTPANHLKLSGLAKGVTDNDRTIDGVSETGELTTVPDNMKGMVISVDGGFRNSFIGGAVGQSEYTDIENLRVKQVVISSASAGTAETGAPNAPQAAKTYIGGVAGKMNNGTLENIKLWADPGQMSVITVDGHDSFVGGFAGQTDAVAISGTRFYYKNLENLTIMTGATATYVGGFMGRHPATSSFNKLFGNNVVIQVGGSGSMVGGLIAENTGSQTNRVIDSELQGLSVTVLAGADNTTAAGVIGHNLGRTGNVNGTNLDKLDRHDAISTVTNVIVAGSITLNSNDSIAAGMTGINESVIANYSKTDNFLLNITGQRNIAGGLVGVNRAANGAVDNTATTKGQLYYTYTDAVFSVDTDGSTIGGLVGENHGTVEASYVDHDLTVADKAVARVSYVGGLAGANAGNIQESFASSNIKVGGKSGAMGQYVGGLIGHQYGVVGTAMVKDSYAYGKVILNAPSNSADIHSVVAYAGGFIGHFTEGQVQFSYAAVEVTATDNRRGGFVGYYDNTNNDRFLRSFFIRDDGSNVNLGILEMGGGQYFELSNNSYLRYIKPTDLKNRNEFNKLGENSWNFTTIWKYGSPNASYLYPELIEVSVKGEESSNFSIVWYTKDPTAPLFELSTAADLQGLAKLVNGTVEGRDPFDFAGKKLVILNPINIQDAQWEIVGRNAANPFRGEIDGQGNLISGLRVKAYDSKTWDYAVNGGTTKSIGALFGYVDVGGAISNFNVEPLDIVGQDYAATLVAYNKGTVTASKATLLADSKVMGGTTGKTGAVVGGLVAVNEGKVDNLFVHTHAGAKLDVSGSQDLIIGGVIGDNQPAAGKTSSNLNARIDGAITVNSGSTAAASSVLGGVVGHQKGTITNKQDASLLNGGKSSFNGAMTARGNNVQVGGMVGVQDDGNLTGLWMEPDKAVTGDTITVAGNSTVFGGVVGTLTKGSIINSAAYFDGVTYNHTGSGITAGGAVGKLMDSQALTVGGGFANSTVTYSDSDNVTVFGGAIGYIDGTNPISVGGGVDAEGEDTIGKVNYSGTQFLFTGSDTVDFAGIVPALPQGSVKNMDVNLSKTIFSQTTGQTALLRFAGGVGEITNGTMDKVNVTMTDAQVTLKNGKTQFGGLVADGTGTTSITNSSVTAANTAAFADKFNVILDVSASTDAVTLGGAVGGTFVGTGTPVSGTYDMDKVTVDGLSMKVTGSGHTSGSDVFGGVVGQANTAILRDVTVKNTVTDLGGNVLTAGGVVGQGTDLVLINPANEKGRLAATAATQTVETIVGGIVGQISIGSADPAMAYATGALAPAYLGVNHGTVSGAKLDVTGPVDSTSAPLSVGGVAGVVNGWSVRGSDSQAAIKTTGFNVANAGGMAGRVEGAKVVIVSNATQPAITADKAQHFNVGGFVGEVNGENDTVLSYNTVRKGVDEWSVAVGQAGAAMNPTIRVGGFAGSLNSLKGVNDSHSAATVFVGVLGDNGKLSGVNSTISAGGFAGVLGDGKVGDTTTTNDVLKVTLENCSATGSVMAHGEGTVHSGGFVGRTNHAVIKSCAYMGDSGIVLSDGYTVRSGGFVGTAGEKTTVDISYATATKVESKGTSAGASYAGGFAGQNRGKINDVYADSAVAATGSGSDSHAGALVGYNYNAALIKKSYYSEDATLKGVDFTGPGSVSDPLYKVDLIDRKADAWWDKNNARTAIWDFATKDAPWTFITGVNGERPVLTGVSNWLTVPEGRALYEYAVGTLNLEVENAGQLALFSKLIGNGGEAYWDLFSADAIPAITGAALTANIDLAARTWSPIENFAAGKTFDGGEKTIRNLYFYAPLYEGYGFVKDNAGSISDVAFTGAYVNAMTDSGVVTSANTGSISKVTVDRSTLLGDIAYRVNAKGETLLGATDKFGLIAGSNSGTIGSVAVTGDGNSVTGHDYLGGVVGQSAAALSDVTVSGELSLNGSSFLGGVAGDSKALTGVDVSGDITATGIGTHLGGVVGKADGAVDVKSLGNVVINLPAEDEKKIPSTSNYVGGAVGESLSGGINVDSFVADSKVDVTGHDYVGGVVGCAVGDVTKAVLNETKAAGNAYVGGVAGKAASLARVSIAGRTDVAGTGSYLGGVAGQANGAVSVNQLGGGTVTGAQQSGKTMTYTDYVGGVVGDNQGAGAISVADSVAHTALIVTGKDYVGGVAGSTNGSITKAILQSVAVRGADRVGGLAGAMAAGGEIQNVLATEVSVTGTGDHVSGMAYDAQGATNINAVKLNVSGVKRVSGILDTVGANRSVSKITLGEAKLTATGDEAAFIAITNNGTINGVTVKSGVISGKNGVAGVASDNYGAIFGADVTGDLTVLGERAGGITGYNHASVTDAAGATITQTRYSGTIEGSAEYAGGVAGVNEGTVKNAYALGSMKLYDTGKLVAAGGIAGINATINLPTVPEGSVDRAGAITASFSQMDIDATGAESTVGGITGENAGAIRDCYTATGAYLRADGTKLTKVGGITGNAIAGEISNNISLAQMTVGSDGVFVRDKTFHGGIAGKMENGAQFTNNIFDTKFSGNNIAGYSAANDAVSGTKGKYVGLASSELLTGELPEGFSAANWAIKVGNYPELTAFSAGANKRTAMESILSVTPILFADGDTINSVISSPFTLTDLASNRTGVEWSTPATAESPAKVNIVKNAVKVTGELVTKDQKTVELVATLADAASGAQLSRTIRANTLGIEFTLVAKMPVFSLPAGAYVGRQEITITSPEADARIFYTTDGSTPTTASTQYTKPVAITADTTLRAIATVAGKGESAVMSSAYQITVEKAGEPVMPIPSNVNFTGSMDVTIYLPSTEKTGTIYYTTDGSTPTTASTKYTAPFTITQTTTIKAILVVSGKENSKMVSRTYVKATSGGGSSGGGGGGGGGSSSATQYYTLTYLAVNGKIEGEVMQRIQSGKNGSSVTAVANPGYVFVSWSDGIKTAVRRDLSVMSDIRVTANFEPVNWFKDVPQDSWFYESVKYAYENGYIMGVSNDLFAPEKSLTRGMLVTILGRVNGADVSGKVCTFQDVDSNSYCAPYVAWAVENKIVMGVGNNKFEPDRAVTRQEMATIFHKYLSYIGAALSAGTSDLPSDVAQVSPWAEDAVKTVYQGGLLTGKEKGRFAPTDTATRAEVAVLIERMLHLTDEK